MLADNGWCSFVKIGVGIGSFDCALRRVVLHHQLRLLRRKIFRAQCNNFSTGITEHESRQHVLVPTTAAHIFGVESIACAHNVPDLERLGQQFIQLVDSITLHVFR